MSKTPTQVSIIGTAGRSVPPGHCLNKALFDAMVRATEAQISALNPNLASVHLVSGGASFSDHVAVVLFLTGRYKALTLYLPAAFDMATCTYVDTGDKDWRRNPGRVSNFYFQRFNQLMALGGGATRNMAKDIKTAFERGAHLDIGKGFHSRNSQVAKSEVVIALTWGAAEPEDGGTADTWKKIPKTSKKIHIGLKTLV